MFKSLPFIILTFNVFIYSKSVMSHDLKIVPAFENSICNNNWVLTPSRLFLGSQQNFSMAKHGGLLTSVGCG